jgi:hypothetical protein
MTLEDDVHLTAALDVRHRALLVITKHSEPSAPRRAPMATPEPLRTRRPSCCSTSTCKGLEIDLLAGRLAVRGLRLAERGGHGPFADVERLELRLHVPSLLRGHLWIREVAVRNSTRSWRS